MRRFIGRGSLLREYLYYPIRGLSYNTFLTLHVTTSEETSSGQDNVVKLLLLAICR
jgi:hypothetical protein